MTANVYVGKVLFSRGNAAVSNAYTGLLGEITFDTDLHTVRAHDGVTAGGYIIPTMANVNAGLVTTFANVDANVAAANLQIGNLWANANTQANSITTLTGNIVTLTANIGNLWANAGVQGGVISTFNSNLLATNTAIVTANIGMKQYVDALVVAANVPYTMGNLHNWTSNVSTIGAALDQLATRINALDHLGQP